MQSHQHVWVTDRRDSLWETRKADYRVPIRTWIQAGTVEPNTEQVDERAIRKVQQQVTHLRWARYSGVMRQRTNANIVTAAASTSKTLRAAAVTMIPSCANKMLMRIAPRGLAV